MARLTKVLPKSRFLAALSFVYLFAFSSIYIQLPGLYGDNGIYPARLTNHAPLANLSDFYGDPDLLRLSPFLKLDTFQMLELCVLIGIVFSFLAAFCESFRTLPVYLFLWLAYFSILKVGQTFLWFQWDLLLVEAGFLALLLAKVAPGFSFSFTSGDRISIWLLRWLLFRLMFSAGVVKLRSNCPAWWSLQALHWHYQSQCIPTPLAWYFHHLPGWFHSLSVASTFIIEILVPLLFFVPLKPVRLFCFYSQVLLQVFIILTGNYNFFNLLTIALCYSLLTDDDFHSSEKKSSGFSAMISNVFSWLLIAVVLALGVHFFNFKFTSDFTVTSSIGFSMDQFKQFLTYTITNVIYLAVPLYFIELLWSAICALRARTIYRKLTELVGVVVVGICGLLLLYWSIVPFASLDRQSLRNLPEVTMNLYKYPRPPYLSNSYGPFARPTREIDKNQRDSSFCYPWSLHAPPRCTQTIFHSLHGILSLQRLR